MYEIGTRELEAHPTLVRRATVGVHELAAWLGETYGLVMSRQEETGATPVGMPFARYQPLGEGDFEVEAGVAIDREIDPGPELVLGELPGGTAATVWHVGPYEAIGPAYDSLSDWVVRAAVTPIGVPWEAYYDDEAGRAEHRTEVVQPFMAA